MRVVTVELDGNVYETARGKRFALRLGEGRTPVYHPKVLKRLRRAVRRNRRLSAQVYLNREGIT